MDKNYEYQTVAIAVEREDHFASDAPAFKLFVNIDGKELCFSIDKFKYTELAKNGIPAYENRYNPIEGRIIKKV